MMPASAMIGSVAAPGISAAVAVRQQRQPARVAAASAGRQRHVMARGPLGPRQSQTSSSTVCMASGPGEAIDKALEGEAGASEVPEEQQKAEDEVPRDDDVLPDSLSDALVRASKATAAALARGNQRCLVEVLLPEFWDPISGPLFNEEGDQQRWWKLTRRFTEELAESTGSTKVRAVYPDMGVAAMLGNMWPDATFKLSSLNDRRPVEPDDELVVLATPDPQGLQDCYRIASQLGEDGPPIVMFNPRLASGDVGIGLNVRRMQKNFLRSFATTYSLRPIQDVGTVFRCYPGLWQVFIQDDALPGRYKLIAERPSRPGGEALDNIIMDALMPEGEDGQKQDPGFMAQVAGTMASMQRFMRSLSN